MPVNVREDLDQEWYFSRIVDVSGGLNTRVPSEALEDPESPDLSNVTFDRRRIETTYGYQKINQTFLGKRPIPVTFPRVNGDIDQLVITDKTLYVLTAGEWRLAQYGALSSVTAVDN